MINELRHVENEKKNKERITMETLRASFTTNSFPPFHRLIFTLLVKATTTAKEYTPQAPHLHNG